MGFNWPRQLIFIPNGKVPHKKSKESMIGKTCVITGATSGVGLETLKEFAKGGANIVIVCRNREKAEKIKAEIIAKYEVLIDIVIADFSSLKDVRKAANIILNKYSSIDVLINSVGMHSTTKKYTVDGYEMVFAVNHLSTFLFTKLLIPSLMESSQARIIQVNSEGHRFNGLRINDINWKKRIYTGLRGYGASKTAQLMTVWEFADRLKGTNITINAVHPGDVRTNIGNNNGRLYKWFLKNVTWNFLKDPVISGESIYYLASDSEIRAVSGRFFNRTIEEEPAKHALNRKKGKRIWNISMEMTGLKENKL